MKVYVYGNTLNSAFHLTKDLRNQGVEAEMFLDNSSPFEQDYPWWDDEALSPDNLPFWIHYFPIFPNFVLPDKKTKQMIKDFSDCDVALVSCYGPILAMKSKVPFVFYSLGSDLNMIDFKDEFKSLLYNTYPPSLKIKKLIKMMTFGRMQAKAIKKYADRIILYLSYQYRPYIVKHNLQDKTVKLTYPMDLINYGAELDEELFNKYKDYDSVFFMFARHSWKSVWNDIKGNDKFIRAFARFVEEKNPNVILIMSNKGIDTSASKALVKKLGIKSKYIQWVDDMPKYLLKKYQALPNIVMVDNFWHDRWYERYPEDKDEPKVGFGFGCLESLASKSLLITAFKSHEFYNGEHPPILDAFTEEEIYQRLLELNQMPVEERDRLRQAGYDFVMKWHEQSNVLFKHINVVKEVYKKSVKNSYR